MLGRLGFVPENGVEDAKIVMSGLVLRIQSKGLFKARNRGREHGLV